MADRECSDGYPAELDYSVLLVCLIAFVSSLSQLRAEFIEENITH